MSAASYTAEEEARYKLPPLPVIPFIGLHESAHRNVEYHAGRVHHRELYPPRDVKVEGQ